MFVVKKGKFCTYSQPSASIPSQSLDEAFLTEVIANKVLVSSKSKTGILSSKRGNTVIEDGSFAVLAGALLPTDIQPMPLIWPVRGEHPKHRVAVCVSE
jgi:hypothetical protein